MPDPDALTSFDFQHFFDDSYELFAIFNRQGDFIRVNPSWSRILGYSNEELIGHNFTEFLHPADLHLTIDKFQELLKKDTDEGFINRYRTKSGKYLYLEWKTRIVQNFQYCTARDVTGRVNDREKLIESEHLFRSLAETSPDVIMRFDREFRHLYVNPVAEKYFGFKPEEFLGKNHEELGFTKEQYTYWDERIEKVFRTAEPHKEVASPDFGNIYFDWVLLPEFDENGKVISVLSITRDISDLIKNKKALEESEEYHRRMFQEHDTVQFRIDTNGNIIDANPAASSFYGYSITKLKTMHLRSIIVSSDNEVPRFLSAIQREDGKGTKLECKHRLADCSVRDVEVHSSPITAAGITYVQSIIIDITESKQAGRIIAEKNEQLAKANAERERFFSILAHDLRSPFIGFLGLLEMVSSDTEEIPSEEIRSYMKSVYNSGLSLYGLLENLLQWANLQRGVLTPLIEQIKLHPLFTAATETVSLNAAQKKITLNSYCDKSITVKADKNMLSTVLRNLLSNAIKYTPNGGSVAITAEQLNGQIIISVSDSGVGMTEEYIQKLFRLGEKIGRKGTQNEPSSGLGLILCKELITRMDGTITVKSTPGKGSVFQLAISN